MLCHIIFGFCQYIGIENLTQDDPDLNQTVMDIIIQPNGGTSSRADYLQCKIKSHNLLFEHDASQLANLALMHQNETIDVIKKPLLD